MKTGTIIFEVHLEMRKIESMHWCHKTVPEVRLWKIIKQSIVIRNSFNKSEVTVDTQHSKIEFADSGAIKIYQ